MQVPTCRILVLAGPEEEVQSSGEKCSNWAIIDRGQSG